MGYRCIMRSPRLVCLLLSLSCGVVTSQAWAKAPVVDLSAEATSSEQAVEQEQDEASRQLSAPPVPSASATRLEKLPEQDMVDMNDPVRLKQQIANYIRMNLPEKIEALQREIAELRGQLEVQAHELKALKDQQQQYSQDLDKNITEQKELPTKSEIAEAGRGKKLPNAEVNKVGVTKTDKLLDERKEQEAYSKAFNLIKEKKYSQAIVGLKDFLKDYPVKEGRDSQYALNAYYWLGELYFLQGQFEQALAQFRAVIKKFPGKPKVADAMLKLGLILANQDKKTEARQTFQEIKKRFPDSSAAHSATMELQKL